MTLDLRLIMAPKKPGASQPAGKGSANVASKKSLSVSTHVESHIKSLLQVLLLFSRAVPAGRPVSAATGAVNVGCSEVIRSIIIIQPAIN